MDELLKDWHPYGEEASYGEYDIQIEVRDEIGRAHV